MRRRGTQHRGVAAILAIVVVTLASARGAFSQTSTPEALTVDNVLAALPFSEADQQRIKSGQLVSANLPSSSNRELAVAMAFTMNMPFATAVTKFRESIYRGDPKVIAFGRIDTGTLDDFKALTLGPQGAAQARAFLNAAPGYSLNLSAQEIAALAALKAQAPAAAQVQTRVEQQLRQFLQARYQAYRNGGLSAIAGYDRGDGQTLQPGTQLRDATNAATVLARFASPIQQMLLNYPHDNPPDLDEKFHWVVFDIDGTPTLALSHRLWTTTGAGAIMVDRLFYVSSGFNTEQAVGGFLPLQNGTIVFYTNRTSTDQVDGFGGAAKRAIGDHMMASDLAQTFQRLRAGSGS